MSMKKTSPKSKERDASYAPLWKDRKRILGMPLSFTRYEVTEDRLITHRGFFSTETNEILLYRILDIKLVRRLGQKMFGVGTITLYSADKSDNRLVIENVKNPDEVRRFLSKLVEQVRASKGVTGREIYGASSGGLNAGAGVGVGAGAGAGVDASQDGMYAYGGSDFIDADGDGMPD